MQLYATRHCRYYGLLIACWINIDSPRLCHRELVLWISLIKREAET
jgi:hypothetical protein